MSACVCVMNLNSSSAGHGNTDHTLVPADSSDISGHICYLSKPDTQPGKRKSWIRVQEHKLCDEQLLCKTDHS